MPRSILRFRSEIWTSYLDHMCKQTESRQQKAVMIAFVFFRIVISVISLGGWRIGQWNLYRRSTWVFSIISIRFHLDRERRFLYEFSVEKLVLTSFRGYLGEIESGGGKAKKMQFFIYFFFLMCNVVSGSALPIFKSYLVKAVALEL